MTLSRRGFFRGAAAAGATVATGGAGKAVQGAVVAAGGAGGTFAGLTKAKAIYEAMLEAGNKFPHGAVSQIGGAIVAKLNDENKLIALQNRLFGDGKFKRYQKDDIYNIKPDGSLELYNQDDDSNGNMLFRYHEREEKIDFSIERSLYYLLSSMPKNIPIKDMLSDDLYQVAIMSGDVGEKSKDGKGETASLDQIRHLQGVLGALCDEETTTTDLKKTLNRFFKNLAEHGLSNPEDFESEISNNRGPFNNTRMSGLNQLCDIMRSIEKDGEDFGNLADRLGTQAKISAKEITLRHREKLKELEKQRSDLRMLRRKRIYKEIKSNQTKQNCTKTQAKPFPSLLVKIHQMSETEFIVDQANKKIPNRLDWFNWMRSIDPEDSKICDIQTSHGHFAITVQNQIAIDFLNTVANENTGEIVLEMPKRQMDADLSLAPENG